MLAADEICALYQERVRDTDALKSRMRRVRDQYNGEWVTPLDDIDRSVMSSVANLLLQGVDQLSRRISSTLPNPDYYPTTPGAERAEKRARIRVQATLGWWEANRLNLKMRARARHLIAYTESGVSVTPTFKRLGDNGDGGPRWRVLDPLLTYPAPRSDPDDPIPADVVTVWTRTHRWLAKHYPEAAARVASNTTAPDTRYDVLHFLSADQQSLVLHARAADDSQWPSVRRAYGTMLETAPNLTGLPLAVVPRLIGLSGPKSSYEAMVGLARQRARLDALTLLAIERGIYPEVWLVSRPGEQAQIVREADGPLGEIGEVRGGSIETVQVQPAYRTELAIDRLERQERLEGGIPAEFGGESQENVRTGRRGEAILSAAIDPRIQEAQEILAESIREEDRIAMAIEKAYFGDASRTFYFGDSRSGGKVDYRPNRDFDSDRHVVVYPVAGADVNYLRVGIGQLLGLGLISQDSARRLDPMIRDAEGEKDRITAEALEMAVLSALQQQAADPQSPLQLPDIAYIYQQVLSNEASLFDAIMAAQQRAQERQAQAVPAGVPQAEPGLAPAGMGMEQPVEGGGGPPSMEALLARMRNPQTTVAVR